MTKILRMGLAAALVAALTAVALPQEKRLKMRVAVAPLDWSLHDYIGNWQMPLEFRNAIYEKLVKKLFDTGRFVILEREAMEPLLQEKAIKEENTGESQKGKIVPAQALVKGAVTDFTVDQRGGGVGVSVPGLGHVGGSVSEARVAINVRIFDVDTSEMIATETAPGRADAAGFNFSGWVGNLGTDFAAYDKSPLGKATNTAIDKAVEAILKKLGSKPWQARVADYDTDSHEITLNAGEEVGVKVGDAFDVFRVTKVIKDPETGQTLGVKTSKIGWIKVTEVQPKFATAIIGDGTGFQTGDIVREKK